MKKIHDEIKNLKSYPRTFMKKVKDFDLESRRKNRNSTNRTQKRKSRKERRNKTRTSCRSERRS